MKIIRAGFGNRNEAFIEKIFQTKLILYIVMRTIREKHY